jgi:hypothetical protein
VERRFRFACSGVNELIVEINATMAVMALRFLAEVESFSPVEPTLTTRPSVKARFCR